jgi:hypothetical protein
MKFNHSYDLMFTVTNDREDGCDVRLEELLAGLARRIADIIESDGAEAFGHNDTIILEDQ